MDILSILGVLMALLAIIGGNLLDGGHTASLVQLTALLIVVGGTLGAVMVQTPLHTFLRAMKISRWVFVPFKLNPEEAAEKIVGWSNIARREGLLGLEAIAEDEPDPFARKGLQLLVDGSEPRNHSQYSRSRNRQQGIPGYTGSQGF